MEIEPEKQTKSFRSKPILKQEVARTEMRERTRRTRTSSFWEGWWIGSWRRSWSRGFQAAGRPRSSPPPPTAGRRRRRRRPAAPCRGGRLRRREAELRGRGGGDVSGGAVAVLWESEAVPSSHRVAASSRGRDPGRAVTGPRIEGFRRRFGRKGRRGFFSIKLKLI